MRRRDVAAAGKRVLLHAGFPKTGTTTIQAALSNQRSGLDALGIVYPDCAVPGLKPSISHPALSLALMWRLPAHFGTVAQADCRAWLAQCLLDFRTTPHSLLLLSHETLSEVARRLRWTRLRGLLSGLDVQALVYVRVLDDYLESRLEQRVRAGECTLADLRDGRAAKRLQRLSNLAKLRALRDGLRLLPVVRSYDQAQAGTGLLGDFARHAGLPLAVFEGQRNENVSVHAADRMFLAYTAQAARDADFLPELRLGLRKARQQGLSPLFNRRFGLLDAASRRRARAIYNQELPRLNAEFACGIAPAPELSTADLDYASQLTPMEFHAMADALEPLLPPAQLAALRGAY